MSMRAVFVNLYLKHKVKPSRDAVLNVEQARRNVIKMAQQNPPVPAAVQHKPVPADPKRGLCPAEWLTGPDAKRTVLYLHGGGYFFCNLDTHRPVAAYFAFRGQARVLSVDYRLAPEHPYPAALDDALGWYRELLDQGVKPENLTIAGDSAGGGLALATMLAARDAGLPLPACAVLFSPWTDLACTGETMRTMADADVMFQPHMLVDAAKLYLNGRRADEPLISPHYAELKGLPPLLIHASNHEVLLSDSIRLHERAQAAGVRSELLRRDKLPHVWPTMVILPEARESLKQSFAFMDRHVR